MITKININILTEDEFKITEEDLAELNRVLQNEHLQSFFIACNVLKVNENYINIIKKEFDTKNNTVSLFLGGYVEKDYLE